MSYDSFLKLLRDSVIDCYTFVVTHDEAVIERKFHWSESADSTARVLDELVGFNVVRDSKFDYGIVHPTAVSHAELAQVARKGVGASMIDAFSPFDRAFRHEFRNVRYEPVFLEHQRDCNIITFGSPSSNDIARGVLGYVSNPGSQFRLDLHPDAPRYPVRYELEEEAATVRRHGGRYAEPKWSIVTPEETLTPALTADGILTEDYLVISCVPNLMSDAVGDALSARRALGALRSERDFRAKISLEADFKKRVSELEKKALPDSDLHRVVVIGGLHGPGTGAARLLLSNPRLAKLLERRVKRENLDGGFWQAVLRIPEIRIDDSSGRDLPARVDDRIDVFPVKIA